jgi:large repetitive protein
VTPPPAYTAPSQVIPPAAAPFAPTGAVGTVVAVQPQATPPTAPVGPGTVYHLVLEVGSGTPDVVHNHIPLDPAVPAGLLLRKTGDKAAGEVGDSIRYTISVRLTAGAAPRQVSVVDRLPSGFAIIPGTSFVDGKRINDPVRGPGNSWVFQLGALSANGTASLQYRVRVGVGAEGGDGINRATAHGCAAPASCLVPGTLTPIAQSRPSNEGQFRVRVRGGVFGADACVLGKVFVDCNNNHVQDSEELGIPGVRLLLQDGTTLISDSEGKFSMCGLPAKSHVLRLDPLTMPRGSRPTTSSNRNLGDAGSLWLDLKRGELHRADFIEGSCSNTVLEQVKARRAQGEVRVPETEKAGRPALRFDSKSQGRNTLTSPQQGTDGANQLAPKLREAGSKPDAGKAANDESNLPTPSLPMNRPPPPGRSSSDAASAAPTAPVNQAGGRP